MSTRDRYGNLLGYVDICMNMLMAFVLLFAFAFLLIKVQDAVVDKTSKISTNSKMVVHMTWNNVSNDDIDVWVKTENPLAIVGFKSKSSRNMFLDNDTLGVSSNAVMVDGQMVSTYGNNEHIHIKECTKTKVTVNVHYYRTSEGIPVEVSVDLIRLEPLATVYSTKLVLDKPGTEKTAFQFDLDENCVATNFTSIQSPFILQKISPGKGM